MLVALGFFVAALIGFVLAPFYRRRAARLATDALKATMPLTSAEIVADKDRLRAQYAMLTHRLERQLEAVTHSAARQLVEINRRDAGISSLEGEVSKLQGSIEEHENARRVLEQTITERLPKVEFRLLEARRLLSQRDREIAGLTHSANRQAAALEEARQINAQQRDELHRVKASVTARAARNRDSFVDPKFDSEVSLRSEVEALRTKARDQAAVIARLQAERGKAKAVEEARSLALPPPLPLVSGVDDEKAGTATSNGATSAAAGSGASSSDSELVQLRKNLSDTESALKSARGMAEAGSAGQRALEAEIGALKRSLEDRQAEVASLKASLKAYEDESLSDRSLKDSKIAMRAKMSALQAQSDEQTMTIQRLRAEVAAANERLARQAAHFMDEMRRLGGTARGVGTSSRTSASTAGSSARLRAGKKGSLVDRISAPRPEGTAKSGSHSFIPPSEMEGNSTVDPDTANKEGGQDPARVSGFLRALGGGAASATTTSKDGNGVATTADDQNKANTEVAGRSEDADRPKSLMERIAQSD